MRLSFGTWLAVGAVAVASAAVALTTFERPAPTVVQRGFRGTAMEVLYNPRMLEVNAYLHQVPEPPEPADDEGPRAR